MYAHWDNRVKPALECLLCAAGFETVEALIAHHGSSYHREHGFEMCRYCGQAFRLAAHLEEHVNAEHEDFVAAEILVSMSLGRRSPPRS